MAMRSLLAGAHVCEQAKVLRVHGRTGSPSSASVQVKEQKARGGCLGGYGR